MVRSGKNIDVLIVDDHQAVSDALAIVVGTQQDMRSAGVAPTLKEAVALCEQGRPDVVLLDVRLPDADGIDGVAQIREAAPAARIVILTAHADLDLMARAASAGACGFLPKTAPVAKILEAIRAAGTGGMLVEQSTLSALVAGLRAPPERKHPTLNARLTPREFDVLVLMGQALDPSAIARRLRISVSTCRGTVQAILRKLESHSQLEAVVKAMRYGIIPTPGAADTATPRVRSQDRGA